jgi:hypothetical protein
MTSENKTQEKKSKDELIERTTINLRRDGGRRVLTNEDVINLLANLSLDLPADIDYTSQERGYFRRIPEGRHRFYLEEYDLLKGEYMIHGSINQRKTRGKGYIASTFYWATSSSNSSLCGFSELNLGRIKELDEIGHYSKEEVALWDKIRKMTDKWFKRGKFPSDKYSKIDAKEIMNSFGGGINYP